MAFVDSLAAFAAAKHRVSMMGHETPVPTLRVQTLNGAPVNPDRDFVLYWMIAHRRVTWNFALQRAVEWALELEKPLVVLEALECDYPYASDRLHRFIIDGMADNAARIGSSGAAYYPYIEPSPGAGKDLIQVLAAAACLIVTDNFPVFFLPKIVAAAARRVPVRVEQVDSNGLLPLASADRLFTSAHSLRRFLQRNLPEHLIEAPLADPLAQVKMPHLASLPEKIAARWPPASPNVLAAPSSLLRSLPVDHWVPPAPIRGGSETAEGVLRRFLEVRLPRYGDDRNHPDREGTSGLSPYLHFGHISAHQVFAELAKREGWDPARVTAGLGGSRAGWWGMSRAAEAFLDQLITWRELGFNMCWLRQDYDRYESLPGWALKTLSEHGSDPRPHLYSMEEFESACTHDPLWNAAQTQLLREGRIHNYLRMLWGKKILEWSPTPREALKIMIELNDKYALDGRDPNSYSGIFWILGRYDRPWGPERPVFGKVRYMSSQNTARKLRVGEYVEKYSPW